VSRHSTPSLRLENRHTGEVLELRRRHQDGEVTLELRGTLPPHQEGPPRHIHHQEDEEGTVTAGTLSVEVEGRRLDAGPGESVVLPRGAAEPVLTGWVLEADRAVAVPLAQWQEGGAASTAAQPAGDEIRREQLTGTVGGAVSWSGVYDAVLNRFAFHDPLAELKTIAPQGVDEDCASYLVAGWWSDPALDPLDKARSNDSLHEMLERLRWRLLYEWGDETWARQQAQAQRAGLGLWGRGGGVQELKSVPAYIAV